MTTTSARRLTEKFIRQAAMARWRVADVMVFRYVDGHKVRTQAERDELAEKVAGEWYGLSVKTGGEWHLVCRRRDLAGLLAMIEGRADCEL